MESGEVVDAEIARHDTGQWLDEGTGHERREATREAPRNEIRTGHVHRPVAAWR